MKRLVNKDIQDTSKNKQTKQDSSHYSYQDILAFPKTSEVALFKNENYKVFFVLVLIRTINWPKHHPSQCLGPKFV